MKRIIPIFACATLFFVSTEGVAYRPPCKTTFLTVDHGECPGEYQRLTVKLLMLSGFELPIGIRGSNLVTYGMELTYKWANNITLEADFINVTDTSTHEPTASLRGGYTLQVHGSDMSGAGLRGFIIPSIGYRYARRPMYEYDGYSAVLRTHNLQTQIGYELEFGDLNKGGVLRFSAGSDYAISSKEVPGIVSYSGDPYTFGLFARISIGISLGFFQSHEDNRRPN